MTTFSPSRLLRLALLGDALASGATGLLLAAGAGPLERWLGLPTDLMRSCGVFLLVYAAGVAWLGRRSLVPPGAVWTVIVLNALWVLDSILLLLNGSLAPTSLGMAFVIAQAIVVAAFAELQYVGLRQRTPTLVPLAA